MNHTNIVLRKNVNVQSNCTKQNNDLKLVMPPKKYKEDYTRPKPCQERFTVYDKDFFSERIEHLRERLQKAYAESERSNLLGLIEINRKILNHLFPNNQIID